MLHLWGLNGVPSLVSAESIALCWLLQEDGRFESVEIVFSNNTDLSPTNELPLLIESCGRRFVGFYSIAMKLLPCGDLLSCGLLQYACDELDKCTEYQLYLNSVNYKEYTSKIYSHLLCWPFWYNTPLSKRNRAQQLCEEFTYSIPEDEEPDDYLSSATEMAQSQVFKITQENKKQYSRQLQDLKINGRFFTKLDQVLTQYVAARESLDKTTVIPADVLVCAHLKVQMSLPQGELLKNHLQSKLPDFYSAVCATIQRFDEQKVANRDASFGESGNILMSTYHMLKSLV